METTSNTPSLKTLTWCNHKKAENTQLMQLLLNNTISPELYTDLLHVKHSVFAAIEQRVSFQEPELNRASLAFQDWTELSRVLPPQLNSLTSYLNHLSTRNSKDIWAHVYVQYLAPLYGGQLIRKIIGDHFPTRHLTFSQPRVCIAEVRSHESLDLAPEANIAFESTMKIYEELYHHHQPHS
jgi:heme oxygenase